MSILRLFYSSMKTICRQELLALFVNVTDSFDRSSVCIFLWRSLKRNFKIGGYSTSTQSNKETVETIAELRIESKRKFRMFEMEYPSLCKRHDGCLTSFYIDSNGTAREFKFKFLHR